MTFLNRRFLLLYTMGVLYLAAGINHFVMPHFYYPLIPDYLGFKHLINNLSGVAELVLAAGLFTKRFRRAAAYGIILMLLAFIPSHIWMITAGGCFSPESLCVPVWTLWLRLTVLQPLLIVWAWTCSRT